MGGNALALLEWCVVDIAVEGMESHRSGGMLFSVEWMIGGVFVWWK